MNGLPYYKAYPRDFIEGTVGMSFEIKAAYRLVLDLIYMQGGDLPDDERYISGLLGCSIRKWKSLRDELVLLGKLTVSGEFLTNKRARVELDSTLRLQEKNSENRSRPNKIKELKSRTFIHTDTDTDTDTELDKETTPSGVARNALPQDDFDHLQSKLVAAVGEANIQPHGSIVVGPIVEMISAGVDLETDILPTIRAKAARMTRPAHSWAYFLPAIRDAYERRIAAGQGLSKPKAAPTGDDAWAKRLRYARQCHMWSEAEHGPAPGSVGCQVPAHLIQSGDGVGWSDFSSARAKVA